MTASLGGEEPEIARVSCRSGGEDGSAAGSGDDLSVEFTLVHPSVMVDGSGDPDGVRVPAGQEALATIERSRMAASSS